MKKKLISGFLAVVMVTGAFLSGCSTAPKRDPVEGVKKAVLDSLKREPADFSELLEKGIKETEDVCDFTLTFPEELKSPYLDFLAEAYSEVEFQVTSIDEKDGSYTARVSYEPIDLEASLEEVNAAYVEAMSDTDLTQSVSALLEEDKKALKDHIINLDGRVLDFTVVEKDGSYNVSEEEIKKALSRAVDGYMKPYEDVCSVLDLRDFFQAYLDASLKGEFTQFMKHSGKTQEEAQVWYESGGAFDPPDDLSQPYRERCSAAVKNIVKQCSYSVGIPKQNGIMDFTVEVVITPNNSLTAAWNEFQNGTYYDIDSASAAFVGILEKYAAAPALGEETIFKAEVNASSFTSVDESSDVYRLVNAICPVPD